MAKIDPPKWYNVNHDARIWSGHAASAQKQGWLRAPAAIKAVDEYKGSFQFVDYGVDTLNGGIDEIEMKEGWPQTWIRIGDTSLEPYDPSPEPEPGPDPEPEPEPEPGPDVQPGDAELGAAVRVVVTRIASFVAPYFN